MRFCFILEEQYAGDEMPLAAARWLADAGHRVDVLEPRATLTRLSELAAGGDGGYDAYVLKAAGDGEGLSLLEAAGAAGLTTINHWRSIRLVRDKAVAMTLARLRGLPVPDSYLVGARDLLGRLAADRYPLVVKPNHGSAGHAVHRVEHPGRLFELRLNGTPERGLLAQSYVLNPGYDVKLYNTGEAVFATRWPSPLHPELEVTPAPLPVTPELRALALGFGRVFGLDIYGVDLVCGPQGWVAVDVNDFPSFHEVPDAPRRVAESILRSARAQQGLRSA